MKTLGRLLLLAPLLLLGACETINAKRDFDRNANFGGYKTYAWAPEPSTQSSVNPAVADAIRASVDKGLAARGYTKAQGKAPDFDVVYHLTSVQKDPRHNTDWGYGAAYRPGNGYYTGWPGNPTTYVVLDQYKAGALVLDFVDVRRQQLVWRGVASSVVTEKAADNAARADQAVRLLLSQFPPPAAPSAPVAH